MSDEWFRKHYEPCVPHRPLWAARKFEKRVRIYRKRRLWQDVPEDAPDPESEPFEEAFERYIEAVPRMPRDFADLRETFANWAKHTYTASAKQRAAIRDAAGRRGLE